MTDDSFFALVNERFPELGADRARRVDSFRKLLAAENEVQNLTRLIDPVPFVEGHLEDVLALEACGFLGTRNLDLGSGGGVPGLLSAAVFPRKWVLTDSERSKADFLSRATEELGLSELVQVHGDRAERVLLGVKVDTVVVRAVGPIERVLGWIGKSSTWNTLVLFKGPSWKEEWEGFSKTSNGRKFKITREYPYEVGSAEKKSRVLVEVRRVPRGTRK